SPICSGRSALTPPSSTPTKESTLWVTDLSHSKTPGIVTYHRQRFLDTFLDTKVLDSKGSARNPGIPGMFWTTGGAGLSRDLCGEACNRGVSASSDSLASLGP